jgi:hypothetical protein
MSVPRRLGSSDVLRAVVTLALSGHPRCVGDRNKVARWRSSISHIPLREWLEVVAITFLAFGRGPRQAVQLYLVSREETVLDIGRARIQSPSPRHGRQDFDAGSPMAEVTIEELQLENRELRDLVILLSATLLRKVAIDPPSSRRSIGSNDVQHLLRESELCFRCARIPGLKTEIASGLEAAGNELLAKAVETETRLQRNKWK